VIAETVAICEYLHNALRFGAGRALVKDRVRCLPDAVEGLQAKGVEGLQMADSLLTGHSFLCGNRLALGQMG
jgi:glutathione S-transferase